MRKWLPLVATCLGSFMLLIDVTIVNVALPDMSRDLSSSFTSLQWVIDAYGLALAALLLAFGSVADRLGHRRTYVFGLIVFAVASVVCGFAIDPTMLVTARAAQGVGGAAMFATTFALINNSYSGRDRGTAYGVWGAVSGAAAAVGPVLGGVLTEGISWRWIFFVNAPIGAATIALTLAVIPIVGARGGKRLDVVGTAAFTLAAAALTFGFTRSADSGWASKTVIVSLAVTVVALIAFLVREAHIETPLIELSLFRRPVFVGVVSAALVMSFSAFAVITYTTIWTQGLLGLSPIESGLVAVPLPVLSSTVSIISGRFMHRVPRRLSIGGGLFVIGVGSLLTALLLTNGASWPVLIPGLAITGLGCGLSVPPMSSAATESIGDERAGIASGAVNTARQLGQALGIALLGTLVASAATSSLRSRGVPDPSSTSQALVGGGGVGRILANAPAATRDHLEQALHAAFASGLRLSYIVAGAAAVLTALVVIRLATPRTASHDTTGDATDSQDITWAESPQTVSGRS